MGNECLKLKQEVVEDLRECTGYTVEEITEWYKVFIKEFPRGQLSYEEFKEMQQKYFLYGDSSMYAEHVFRAYDTNCDGVIDFKEYLTATYNNSRGAFKRKLKLLFKIFDIDGDGYISPYEMTEVVRSLYKIDFMTMPEEVAYALSRKRTAKAFRLLDRNFDGRISLDEMIEGARRDASVLRLFQLETQCLRWPPTT